MRTSNTHTNRQELPQEETSSLCGVNMCME